MKAWKFNGSCPMKKLFQIKNSKITASKHLKIKNNIKGLNSCEFL